jgi:hypothetical protein
MTNQGSRRGLQSRQRLTFRADAADSKSPIPLELGPLIFDVKFTDGRRPFRVDLSWFSRPGLGRELAQSFYCLADQPGAIASPGSASTYRNSLKCFSAYLEQRGDRENRIACSEDLRADHLNGFEDWLRLTYGKTSGTPYSYLTCVASLLRYRASALGTVYPECLAERLTHNADGGKGRSVPVDSWSPSVAARIRQVCRREMGAVLRRFAAAERDLVSAADPRFVGWDAPNALLWEAAHTGPLTHAHLAIQWPSRMRRRVLVAVVNERLYPTERDLLPFAILLILETAIPIECVRELLTDCLQNGDATPGRRSIEIHYLKRRSGEVPERHDRFVDGGSTTPGGIIRNALRLTARLRALAGSENLWRVYFKHGNRTPGFQASTAAKWARDKGLVDDDGRPLAFNWMKLRKTAWNVRYKRFGTLSRIVTREHSREVAGLHYAAVASSTGIHEDAVEAAQHAALTDVRKSRVVTSSEELLMRGDPASAAIDLGVDATDVLPLLDGERDVGLNDCINMKELPRGAPGVPCPGPYAGPYFLCLDCPNAVITARKIPSLLRFIEIMTEDRDLLSATDWLAHWGHAWDRSHQYLGAFTEGEVALARERVQADRPVVYLPLEARLHHVSC